jgi:hypothetical protein
VTARDLNAVQLSYNLEILCALHIYIVYKVSVIAWAIW